MNTVFTLGLVPDVIEQLKAKGVESEPAPAELSQLAEDHPGAVVLTSQTRPELNELLAAHDGIKAILLAGPADNADIVPDLLRQHWFGYFAPPFDWDEVRSAVHEAAAIQSWSDGIELLSARPNWLTLQVRCRRYTRNGWSGLSANWWRTSPPRKGNESARLSAKSF